MIKNYNQFINEKLILKDWNLYIQLVAEAYENAQIYNQNVLHHWKSLNESNYKLFKRLLSKVNIIFVAINIAKYFNQLAILYGQINNTPKLIYV